VPRCTVDTRCFHNRHIEAGTEPDDPPPKNKVREDQPQIHLSSFSRWTRDISITPSIPSSDISITPSIPAPRRPPGRLVIVVQHRIARSRPFTRQKDFYAMARGSLYSGAGKTQVPLEIETSDGLPLSTRTTAVVRSTGRRGPVRRCGVPWAFLQPRAWAP
jgi:hypothetical protein